MPDSCLQYMLMPFVVLSDVPNSSINLDDLVNQPPEGNPQETLALTCDLNILICGHTLLRKHK